MSRIVKLGRGPAHTNHSKHHIHKQTSIISTLPNLSTYPTCQRHCRTHLNEPISPKTGPGQVGRAHLTPPLPHSAPSIGNGLVRGRIGQRGMMRKAKVEWLVRRLWRRMLGWGIELCPICL